MNNKKAPPLLIITIDGAQEKWLKEWCNQGSLPILSSILNKGAHGSIESKEQYAEHGIEVSLFSGVSIAEHGYYHYRKIEKGTYSLKQAIPQQAKSKPFWAKLPNTTKIALLDLAEVPFLENLNGIQVTNWLAHQGLDPPLPPETQPQNLLKEIKTLYGKRDHTYEYKANTNFKEDFKCYQTYLKQIKRKGKLIRTLLKKDNFKVIATAFYEIHRASHRLWHHYPDSNKDTTVKNWLKKLYECIDEELGKILATFQNEVNIFLISAFGMKSQYPTGELMEDFCQKLGYQKNRDTWKGKNKSAINPFAISRKIIPQPVRKKISELLGRNMQERLLQSKMEETIDWTKTTVFAQPALYTGLLRINLEGREPKGIVNAKREYAPLLKKVKKDLSLLVDPTTGESIIESITCPYELYGSIPKNLPDLFVEWKEKETFLPKVIHPKCALTQAKPAYYRNSWHKFKGLWAACGPTISTEKNPQIKGILDFAPLFIKLAKSSGI